jgi:tagatose 6-phosphate kinase
MRRVVTVTPNAAVDRTVYVESLRPGTRHRVLHEHEQAGGKGVNVARVLHALGVPVETLVVVAGAEGDWIVRDLRAAGLAPVAVPAHGRSRSCLEIVEECSGQATQIHGDGARADALTAIALDEAVTRALSEASWLVLCGSLCPGLPDETYARLIARARTRGVRVALDASGPALRLGWAAAPDLLRINRGEAAGALDSTPESVALPPLREPGRAEWSVVSDGAHLAIAWSRGRERVYQVTPPVIRARNPIGAGDAMMAGLLVTLASEPIEQALRFATALGSADAESRVAGRPDLDRARALAARVCVANATVCA